MSSSGDATSAITKSTRCRSHFDTTVLVKVGPEAQRFTIHKGLLCAVSTYFKAALEGGFKEAEEQMIRLPEDDVEVFEHFQLWVYTGSFMEPGETEKEKDCNIFIGLYLFAEARGIPELQNSAIDSYINKFVALETVHTNRFRGIYDNTMASSPLRRLITEFTVRCGGPLWFGEAAEEIWNKEILLEVVRGLLQEKEKERRVESFDRFKTCHCDYHVHAEGEPRCNEKA